MYVMIVLIPDHAQKVTPVGKGVMGVMITNINCSCENYNDLIHFITHCYLILACFPVGIVYIPVQKLIFSILTHDQKQSVGNV